MKTAQEVLEHHLQAFGEGIDAILTDYDENSVIISQRGVFKGLIEVRAFFTAFVAGLPEGFMEAFEVTQVRSEGDVAYMTWVANPWFPLGTDTFVVKNGKISCQTFAAYSPE